ncbi:MAG: Diguanylate cyclase [Chlorobi bacterium]|nr:Diguanylate cyclase [Chlorobiota bacterium]
MALNPTSFREAIKPQDAAAFIITLLGVAIAIFLPDAVIKLIGGSIALLGLIALYVTVKQRISDQVQLKTRRTTLPPPAFKTRITQDPTSNTKRILFDDFQESFAPVDDDPEPVRDGQEGFRVARPSTSGVSEPVPVEPEPIAPEISGSAAVVSGDAARPRTVVTRSFGSDDADEADDDAPADFRGESFRVVTVKKKEPARQIPGIPEEELPLPTVPRGTRSETPVQVPSHQEDGVAIPEPVAVEAMEPRSVAQEPTANRKQAQFILDDLVSDGDDDGRGSEPRGEFVRLVGQVLNAIARSIKARSIVFFWVNFEKDHLIPEAKVTTGGIGIRGGARIRLGNDVVSQIARSGVPEVITDISPAAERELIVYYDGPADTRSFVGVPVFFRREVVGVLAADSTDESGFDEVSVATLAEYTRLISGLIRSYTEKYDLHLIARTLDSFEKMSHDFSGAAPSPVHIAEALAGQIAELFDTLYVALVLFDEEHGEWRVASVVSETMAEAVKGLQPDMRGSLVGRATRFAEDVLVEQLGHEMRIGQREEFEEGGTFLALPLVATTKCYGALAVEHRAPFAYIPRDIELMRDLTHYAAMAIEVFNTNRAIEAQVMLDESTGLYNADFLLAALAREIARARDFRQKLSFALISIDLPASIRAENSPEMEEIIIASVGSMLQSAIRPYDTVGRYNQHLFGAVLVERGDQEAYLWAEKLRKEVASRILAVGQRKSAVTISVGISDISSELSSHQAMIDGALQALEKARGGDGNAVILY